MKVGKTCAQRRRIALPIGSRTGAPPLPNVKTQYASELALYIADRIYKAVDWNGILSLGSLHTTQTKYSLFQRVLVCVVLSHFQDTGFLGSVFSLPL